MTILLCRKIHSDHLTSMSSAFAPNRHLCGERVSSRLGKWWMNLPEFDPLEGLAN